MSAMIYQIKKADVPGEPRKGFEQSFASLAYSYIADRAPALMPYLVGFQLLEKSPDNRKAAGIFGFLVDKDWLDIPCFFMEGSIKGHGLLYLRNKNQFVPVKENWINYLIGRKPSILGRMEPKTQSQLGARYPELYRLRVPPAQLKYSSLHSPEPWAKGALSKWAHLIVDSVPAAPQLSLTDIAARHPELAVKLATWCGQYPAIAEGLEKFYGGMPSLVGVLKQARWQWIRRQKQSAILSRQPDEEEQIEDKKTKRRKRSPVLEPDLDYYTWLADRQLQYDKLRKLPVQKRSSDLEIYRSLEALSLADGLTDEERKHFLDQGYLIRDRRPLSKCAVALDEKKEFSTDTRTGTQKILLVDGSLSPCFVAKQLDPYRGPDSSLGYARTGSRMVSSRFAIPRLVVQFDGPSWTEVYYADELVSLKDRSEVSSVLARQQADFPSSRVVSPQDLKEGAVYLIALPQANEWYALPPVFIKEVQEQDGNVVASASCKHYDWDVLILCFVSSDRPRTFERQRTSTSAIVRIPRHATIVRLLDPSPCEKCGYHSSLCNCPSPSSKKRPDQLSLGNFGMVSDMLVKRSAVIKAASWAGGNEFLLSGCQHPLPGRDAVIYLVTRHHLREEDAKQLLAKAAAMGEYSIRVKRADVSLEDNRSYGPQLWPEDIQMEDQMGYEHSVPARYPIAITSTVPGLGASEKFDPFAHDPRNVPPPPMEALQVAQQASRLGQKDIFDTTVLAAMLRTKTEAGMVDQYIGDLLRALDRLGRILFKMYWHYEEFEKRYGKKDMPELEDTLLYAFETLGDLTLFLMRKAVSPFSLGEENAGPSLDETAVSEQGETS